MSTVHYRERMGYVTACGIGPEAELWYFEVTGAKEAVHCGRCKVALEAAALEQERELAEITAARAALREVQP